jgi:hypothetical protein
MSCTVADVREALGIVSRRAWVWGLLLALSIVGRDTLDWWLAPTNDFYARSIVSTAIAIGLFIGAGMWTAARSYSVRGGILAGFLAGVISAAMVDLISLAMLAARHDPHTMAMIRASGGLDEVFMLPLLVVLPGTLCATAGALVGKSFARLLGSRPAE